jgi:hypothetical protein
MLYRMARRLLVPSLVALCGAAVVAWLGMAGGYLWTDYEYANVEPFDALIRGDLGAFFTSAPIEGPSLLLRAPFALLPSLWGGGQSAVFRTVAIPGLLAAAVLGVLLWELRSRLWGASPWRWAFLALAVANPITLDALEIGHPEEIMGAALCCAAVLAALRDHDLLAGLFLGLALANKAWAVLAIGPVLLALSAHRLRTLTLAGGLALLAVAPFLLDPRSRSSFATAGTTNTVFQPWQIWWPLGEHGHVIRGMTGAIKPDYRAAPGWIAPITHPLIAFLVVPAGLAWQRLRGGRSRDLLLLLAALLLARCVLDAANNAYYHLPFLFALLTWETVRSARPPVLSLAAAGLVWLTCDKLPLAVSPDLQCLAYLAWAVPALVVLTGVALGARQPHRRLAGMPAP